MNHNPICVCPPMYTGDPFFACKPIRKHNIHNVYFLVPYGGTRHFISNGRSSTMIRN